MDRGEGTTDYQGRGKVLLNLASAIVSGININW